MIPLTRHIRGLALSALALGLFCALAASAGCGGRARRERAEWLAKWVSSQSYSTFSTFKRLDRTPHQPPSPDGLTLGSPHVFAAIGCNEKDLASVDVFWADEKTARPVAHPMAAALKVDDSGPAPLGELPQQTLRRVRHTAIVVSQSEGRGFRVTAVDFAPMGAKDSFLARWFLVENTDRSAHRARLSVTISGMGEWVRGGARTWQLGDRLAIVSDAKLTQQGDSVEVNLGRLRSGGRSAVALLIVGARDRQRLSEYVTIAEATVSRLPQVLDETRSNWEQWCNQIHLVTDDERTNDLLDSLLCLVRTHIGTTAVHTGSVHYPHNRAWVRDNYWVQRTLLELGLTTEAQLNLDFFHQAWKKSGLASYYDIPQGLGAQYGYDQVELPHYLVLMVRDAEQFAGVDGTEYWDMVQGCLDKAAVPPDGLQPMNGDETWLLASPVRELDSLLDNSWLLIASAEYAARLAQQVGDGQRAARYGALAYRARLALTRFQPASYQPGWYAVGRGGDGTLDFSLCPEVFARGVILGVIPPDDAWPLYKGLIASWEQLGFDRGIRTHSRSSTICGGTPGYVLYAASENDGCDYEFNRELARRMLQFASATGCVWEYHDLHDPAWGGEKRRLWDSAVLLLGLVHALFDIDRVDGTVTFVPKGPPQPVEWERDLALSLDPKTGEALIQNAGPALILQEASPEHAARIARELLRQCSKQERTQGFAQFAVGSFTGEPPQDQSAIIISPSPAPMDWRVEGSYWMRQWDGPPQVWVMNNGDVWRDTEPLLRDLLSALTPQREKPLSYPDASFDLAARFGEEPSGEAEVAASAGGAVSMASLDLTGGRAELRPGGESIAVDAGFDKQRRVLQLGVRAATPRPQPLEATVTLPPGWWLVGARDMTGRWDRVRDPAAEYHLPDGRTRLYYGFRPGTDPVYLTFELARLKVASAP